MEEKNQIMRPNSSVLSSREQRDKNKNYYVVRPQSQGRNLIKQNLPQKDSTPMQSTRSLNKSFDVSQSRQHINMTGLGKNTDVVNTEFYIPGRNVYNFNWMQNIVMEKYKIDSIALEIDVKGRDFERSARVMEELKNQMTEQNNLKKQLKDHIKRLQNEISTTKLQILNKQKNQESIHSQAISKNQNTSKMASNNFIITTESSGLEREVRKSNKEIQEADQTLQQLDQDVNLENQKIKLVKSLIKEIQKNIQNTTKEKEFFKQKLCSNKKLLDQLREKARFMVSNF